MTVRTPSKRTLDRYGLSVQEWRAMLDRQGGVCAVCKQVPANNMLTIDHEHARRWRFKPPEQRKLYVRCLACTMCNRLWLRKGVTPDKLRNAAKVLEDYKEKWSK